MTEGSKDINSLKTTIEQRMFEISKFWSDLLEIYDDINEFVPTLNALIQSLRNITFIIQSHKNIVPDFDEWYTAKQAEMKNDPLILWIPASRNTIVKSSNLRLKSVTSIELVNWERFPLRYVVSDPLQENDEVITTALNDISEDALSELFRDPLLRIERSWVADNLPEKELLALTSYAYRYFKKIVVELFVKLMIDTSNLEQIEKNRLILQDYELFENNRTVILNLRDKGLLSRHTIVEKRTKKSDRVVTKRYGPIKPPKGQTGDEFLDTLSQNIQFAKIILSKDGVHVPIIFFFKKDHPPDISTFVLDSRATLYYMMRKYADDIRENSITAVIITTEVWSRREGFEIDGEALCIAALRKNFFELHLISFSRNKKEIVFGNEEIITDIDNAPSFRPIYEAINGLQS